MIRIQTRRHNVFSGCCLVWVVKRACSSYAPAHRWCKGQNTGQCAILPLLSKTAAAWAEKVGSGLLRARKVSVIFIPAAESLPCQGNGKLEERFRALLQYRKELRIPETNRPIMSYTDASLNWQGQVPFFCSRRRKSFSGDGHRCCEARADHFRGPTAHCCCRVRWVECRTHQGAQPVGSIRCQTAFAFMAQPGENLLSHRTGDAQPGENLVSQGDAQPA